MRRVLVATAAEAYTTLLARPRTASTARRLCTCGLAMAPALQQGVM
jgi:hypothetical protein